MALCEGGKWLMEVMVVSKCLFNVFGVRIVKK